MAASTRRNAPARNRSGLTLLELLLVLALLVVVASMAIPALSGPLENERLRKSADLVRAELASARVRAMRSGRIQMFQYTIGGGDYRLEPYFSDDDLLESSDAGFAAPLEMGVNPDSVADTGKLPEGILFFAGESVSDARGAEVQQQALTGGALDTTTSGQPILFYPDGSSSAATVIITNERQRFVTITLRALTGIAQVSDSQTVEQLGL